MRPRLKVRNLIKYSDHVSLDRDLLILEKALNGKIPEFDASEDWRLPIPIEQRHRLLLFSFQMTISIED